MSASIYPRRRFWRLRQGWSRLLNRCRRTCHLGTWWEEMPRGYPGEPVPILPLVHPLRYDILLRKRFLDLLPRDPAEYRRRREEILAGARRHPYRVWFEVIVIRRYFPELLADPARLELAFAQRVDASAALIASIAARGFDPAHPVTLHLAELVVGPAADRLSDRRWFAGDGNHRLACLMSLGFEELPPSYVRVIRFNRYRPRDNTALLAPHLTIDWSPEVRP